MKVKIYAKADLLGEDGSAIFVNRVRENYILGKFEDRQRIIQRTHAKEPFLLRHTLELIRRTY
jgi:hypothetical protein